MANPAIVMAGLNNKQIPHPQGVRNDDLRNHGESGMTYRVAQGALCGNDKNNAPGTPSAPSTLR